MLQQKGTPLEMAAADALEQSLITKAQEKVAAEGFCLRARVRNA